MLIVVAFLLNSAGNFGLGLALSAILGPAEFGRYATASLAAITLAGGVFDWLRLATIRYAGDKERRVDMVASLEAAYLFVTLGLFVAAGILAALGLNFGLGAALVVLTPLYTIAINRVDYSAAQFRARDLSRAFASIFALRQLFCFAAALIVAFVRRDATTAIATLAVANLIASIALGPALRVPGARLSAARLRDVFSFFVYAEPLVASFVIYALISLVNRQVAFARLGAGETGEFSLAFDLSQRLFQVLYGVPDIFLFQLALRRDREHGRAAAKAQIAVNAVLALAAFLPIAAGYFVMAPTFERLIVPMAYRGEFSRLSLELAPGLVAYGALAIAVNPVFQLAQRTWPVTAAAAFAFVIDLGLLAFTNMAASVEGLARAYSISVAFAAVVAAAVAFRDPAVRPRLRDLLALCGATALMVALVRPLNGLASPALAAAASVALGGGVYGLTLFVFDVAGLRGELVARWRALGARSPDAQALP